MADNGEGMADGDETSRNRKRKYASDLEFICDNVKLVENGSSDEDVLGYGEIKILTATGKIIPLEVSGSDTVGSVKVKIQGKERVPFDEQELIFNGKVLNNMNILMNLRIKKGSTVTLGAKSVDLMKISVVTFSGKTIPLLVDPTCSIAELKTKIKQEEDIPCDEQALIYNNEVLGDDGTLFDYYINRNATLKLLRQSTGFIEIDIYVESFGDYLTLYVKPSDTIYSVKKIIKGSTDKPCGEQDLIFNGVVLHNNDTIANSHIIKGSTLILLYSSRVFIIKIFIKTRTEKSFTLDVKPSDTIYNVKTKIQDKKGIPLWKQRLTFGNVLLKDSATIADYHIRHEHEVLLFGG